MFSWIICLYPCKYIPTMNKWWQCPDTIVQDGEGWYLQLYNWLNEISLVVKLTVKPGLHYLTNPCLYSCNQTVCYSTSKMIHCHMVSPLSKSVNPWHLIPVLSAAAANVLLQLKSSRVYVTHKMEVMKKEKKKKSVWNSPKKCINLQNRALFQQQLGTEWNCLLAPGCWGFE